MYKIYDQETDYSPYPSALAGTTCILLLLFNCGKEHSSLRAHLVKMDLDNQSSQVVLSIQFQKDRLGACIYREAEKSLEICEFWDHGPLEPPSLREVCLSSNDDDTPLSGDSFPALMSLLHQIEPTKVLAPARSDDSLITALNDYIALEKEKQVACT